MAGTFFGISVANSGLKAQRLAMDLLGQNIAHANDPTYRRQRLVLSEGVPLAQSQDAQISGGGLIGTGVMAGAVQRIRSSLIENRVQNASESAAQWEFMSNIMLQIEAALGEPSDTGLQSDLDRFWASWQKVATSPDFVSVRGALLGDAAALAARIQYTYNQISNVGLDLDMSTINAVDQINLMANEVARLNLEIDAMEAGGHNANALLDHRDALVLELSKLVSVNRHGESGNDFILSINGRVLVQGSRANQLMSEPGPNDRQVVKWASDGEDVVAQGGKLKAILDLNHVLLPDYLAQMDSLAVHLVTQVNALHNTGKTMGGADGGDFFQAGTTAANIALDAAIADQPGLVAASASGAIGDGEIALQIALLKDTAVQNNMSMDQLYRALVADIGGSAATADKRTAAHNVSLQQFTAQQQSISGVSLDEELTNMIKFQQAYNAAARTLSVMDEMLDVLISRTGGWR